MVDSEGEFKFIKPGEVRTRFAPAPTGFLHIGGARTCLFNFLFTKKYQGRFILRIEDTDVERSAKESEKDILDSLKWLGIEWDEGPDIDGDYGPYRQSKRREIYARYLKKLLDEEKAYYCFCSEEDLEARRQYLMSIGQPPIYDGKCAKLSKETVEKYLSEGKKPIVRFRTPAKKIVFKDLIRDEIEFDTNLIGDFSLAKNQNSPLYNCACAIDDFEMKISHVIRGEEHISNTPKQILIQEALDFPRPQYAHLPMILGSNRSKLSKRHDAIGIADYKREGYLSEALVNFMAFLGWNPGTEREIFSMASLIKEFSLERTKKGGAVFNLKRLDFLNGFYIRQKPLDILTKECLPYLIEAGLIKQEKPEEPKGEEFPSATPVFTIVKTGQSLEFEYLKRIVAIYQERLKRLSEITKLIDFFFKQRLDYKKELLSWKKQSDEHVANTLDRLDEVLSNIEDDDWTKENLEEILTKQAEEWSRIVLAPQQPGYGQDRGYLLWPLRAALTGKKASAGPFDIAAILGKEKTLQRIKEAKNLVIGN